MGLLPAERTVTFTQGSQVFSVVLNELQDRDIATNIRLNGYRAALTMIVNVPISTPQVSIAPLAQIGAVVSGTGSGSHVLYVELPTVVGWTIASLKARILDSATGPTKLEMKLLTTTDGAQNLALVSTSAASSGAGAEQNLSLTPALLVAANTTYVVSVSTNTGSANCPVYRLTMGLTAPVT